MAAAAYRHDGAARRLIHRLKYGGLAAAAGPLAAAMVPLLPPDAACLVPVPRAVARRWRYGVDPAIELARAMSRLGGLPLRAALGSPLWWARRAGPGARRRGSPSFRRRMPAPSGAILVDDVLTTGTTLVAAARVMGGVHHAVTATAAVPAVPRRR